MNAETAPLLPPNPGGFAAQTPVPSWLCTGKADMVRFCISKEHMFGINQTTFCPSWSWSSGKRGTLVRSEFRRKGHGARAKTHVGESSSRPPGHLKPQSRCEPKLASDGQPPGQRRRPSLANGEGNESEREPTEHRPEKNQVGRWAHLASGHRL